MPEAFLYTWDRTAQQWAVRDVCKSEDEARERGRALWKAGVAGVRIDAVITVVEEKRTQ